MHEKKANTSISIKMINKIISEFNLITRVAPKPIQYSKLRPTRYQRSGIKAPLKRTEILYSMDLLELLKFMNKKLPTLLHRILFISDQSDPDVSATRTSSFKCLKDLLDLLLTQFEKFNNNIKYEIV